MRFMVLAFILIGLSKPVHSSASAYEFLKEMCEDLYANPTRQRAALAFISYDVAVNGTGNRECIAQYIDIEKSCEEFYSRLSSHRQNNEYNLNILTYIQGACFLVTSGCLMYLYWKARHTVPAQNPIIIPAQNPIFVPAQNPHNRRPHNSLDNFNLTSGV